MTGTLTVLVRKPARMAAAWAEMIITIVHLVYIGPLLREPHGVSAERGLAHKTARLIPIDTESQFAGFPQQIEIVDGATHLQRRPVLHVS